MIETNKFFFELKFAGFLGTMDEVIFRDALTHYIFKASV